MNFRSQNWRWGRLTLWELLCQIELYGLKVRRGEELTFELETSFIRPLGGWWLWIAWHLSCLELYVNLLFHLKLLSRDFTTHLSAEVETLRPSDPSWG